MRDDNKTTNFLSHINKPISEHGIALVYASYNVRYDRCAVYSDFVVSLFEIIFDTYMGDDITSVEERLNHFNWCWNKNIKNFKEEGIDLSGSNKLHDYFLEFIFEVYYSLEHKESNKQVTANIIKLWRYMFNLNAIKGESDINSFIEVYNIFEKSLKNIN